MTQKLDWLLFFGVLLMAVLLFSHLAFKAQKRLEASSDFYFVEAEK